MKQLFTLFFALMILAGSAMAQASFVAIPAAVEVNADPNVYDTEAHVEVVNLTNSDIELKWERIVLNITQGCQTQVCDPNLCYLPSVSSRNFILGAQDTAILIVHFLNPTQEPASALVHLKLTNLGNPSDTLTASYSFTGVSSTKNLTPIAQAKVFPNPTSDYFQLADAADAARIRLFDRAGRQVALLNASSNQRYSLSDVPAGLYILAVEDENGKIIQSGEIYKR